MATMATAEISSGVAGVQLRLLGGFELALGDEVVELQPAVQRLVAFVALTPRGVNRDFAAYQLWPDRSETRAKANLRSTLWRLHQLADGVVRVSPTRMRLGDGVWVDVRDEQSDPIVDETIPTPFGTLLPDLLPDWYDEWLIVERERQRQHRLATLEARARLAMAASDPGAAIQFALAAIAIESTRESAHRLVLDAHLAEGNTWEAERERARFARCLAS